MAKRNSLSYTWRSLQNGRDQNEDSYQIMALFPRVGASEPVYLLAVADGMGGHAYGEVVSKEALRKISMSLVDALCIEPGINRGGETDGALPVEALRSYLYESFQQANAYIRRMVEANHWGKAGTTVVIALILGQKVIVGNLGDSPLFHFQRQSGELIKRTEDHTVAGVLLRGGLITEEMARFHEGKGRLEFFIGAERLPKEPPIWDFEAQADDLLLLCSDGISGNLTHPQIAAVLGNPELDLEQKADALVGAALDAGETDNLTLILWQVRRCDDLEQLDATQAAFDSFAGTVDNVCV